MKGIKIFKIGGSVLKTPDDFLKIAKKLSECESKKICIVTSAIKGKTSELVEMFLKAIPEPEFWDFEKFVGFGEIQSAILFEASFNFLKIKSKAILPWTKEWPLYVLLKNKASLSKKKINEMRNFVLLRKSKTKIKEHLVPLFKKNRILIIPGFIAKDGKGRMVTLGRGGSDISAFLMGELLRAEELILIKEAKGILSLDPTLQQDAERITSLDSEELGIIASSGAQVLNPVSLKHQKNLRKVKVVSIESNLDKDSGTEIYLKKGITINSSPNVYSVLTFVGKQIPETHGILYRISEILAKNRISIYSITISDNLIAIYVEKKKGKFAYKLLSPLVNKQKNLKVLNLKKDISKVLIRSLKFINEPGIIKKIVGPISKQGINIWEVLTVHTDVMIFVENKDLKRTFKIICQLFKKRIPKK